MGDASAHVNRIQKLLFYASFGQLIAWDRRLAIASINHVVGSKWTLKVGMAWTLHIRKKKKGKYLRAEKL